MMIAFLIDRVCFGRCKSVWIKHLMIILSVSMYSVAVRAPRTGNNSRQVYHISIMVDVPEDTHKVWQANSHTSAVSLQSKKQSRHIAVSMWSKFVTLRSLLINFYCLRNRSMSAIEKKQQKNAIKEEEEEKRTIKQEEHSTKKEEETHTIKPEEHRIKKEPNEDDDKLITATWLNCFLRRTNIITSNICPIKVQLKAKLHVDTLRNAFEFEWIACVQRYMCDLLCRIKDACR